MSARRRKAGSNHGMVLQKCQQVLFILHHTNCVSIFSDKLDDDRYLRINYIGEAKKIAEMENKPILRCSICCK